MDKMMVTAIEAVWTVQKRLPSIFTERKNKVTFTVMAALGIAIHLTLLAVIISMVTVQWVALNLAN